MTYRRSGTQ